MNSVDQTMRFGGGGGTSLSPVAVLVLALSAIALFALPRRYMIVPLFITSFFIPLSQQVVVAGVHFMLFRILLIFAWIRILSSGMLVLSGESRFRMTAIDKAVILYAITSAVAFVLLWQQPGAAIQRAGFLYDTFGLYFLFRLVIRDEDDARMAVKALVFICSVLAVCMLNEKITGRNLFSVFGGVPEFSYIREGKLRAQGAFAHPILTGTFGATLLPLFVGLWWQKMKSLAAVGVVCSTVITLASASSTPIMGFMGGVGALCLWPIRQRMRVLRWGVLVCLVVLHFSMKAPVWALIGRVDLVGGSSSSHRYELVNRAIENFSQWWLVGIRNVSSWGFEMGDTSNQYIDIGVTGGFFSVAFFIAIIAYGFKTVGVARKAVAGDSARERRIWALGSALFANVVAFMGISYFDQTIVAWYTLLASIAALPFLQTAAVPASPAPASAPELSIAEYAYARFGDRSAR